MGAPPEQTIGTPPSTVKSTVPDETTNGETVAVKTIGPPDGAGLRLEVSVSAVPVQSIIEELLLR
jgi:hypothetical protein